jgi:hypothetical protein
MGDNEEALYVVRSFMASCKDYMTKQDRSGDPSKISTLPLSYNCPRQRFLYYQVVSIEFHDLRTFNSFLKGHVYHQIPVFSNGEHELQLVWEGIVGHPDDYDPVNHILVDKKFTENPPKKVKYGWEDPLKEPAEPRPNHAKQTEYYKVQLEEGYEFNGTPSRRPVKSIYILYKKTGDPDYMAMASKVNFRSSDTIKTEMRQRRDEYKKSILENKIPDGEMGWECGYCDFFSLCMDRKLTAQWGDTWL